MLRTQIGTNSIYRHAATAVDRCRGIGHLLQVFGRTPCNILRMSEEHRRIKLKATEGMGKERVPELSAGQGQKRVGETGLSSVGCGLHELFRDNFTSCKNSALLLQLDSNKTLKVVQIYPPPRPATTMRLKSSSSILIRQIHL